MKKWMCICAAAILMVSALTGCGVSAGAVTTAAQTEASKEEASKAETAKEEITKTLEVSEEAGDTVSEEIQAAAGKHHVKINIKDYEIISVEPHGDEIPITVTSFLGLVKDGFYDGLIFHRIISGSMIQDNDPLGANMGGSDRETKSEFSNNGVESPLPYTRGVISMARSQIKDNASLQFSTVHEDSTFLGGDCACFGYVIEGMEVVDIICKDTKMEDNSGSVAKVNQPVIESVEAVDR